MFERNPKRRKKSHEASGSLTSLSALKTASDASIRHPECLFGGTLIAIYPYNTTSQHLALEIQDTDDKTRKARVSLVGNSWTGSPDISAVLQPSCTIAFDTRISSEYRPYLDKGASNGPYRLSFGGIRSNGPCSKVRLFINQQWRTYEDCQPNDTPQSTTNHLATSAPTSPATREKSVTHVDSTEELGASAAEVTFMRAVRSDHVPVESSAGPVRPSGLVVSVSTILMCMIQSAYAPSSLVLCTPSLAKYKMPAARSSM